MEFWGFGFRALGLSARLPVQPKERQGAASRSDFAYPKGPCIHVNILCPQSTYIGATLGPMYIL